MSLLLFAGMLLHLGGGIVVQTQREAAGVKIGSLCSNLLREVQMDKKQFLAELDEILGDSAYIGKSIEDIGEEISRNMWSISLSQQLAAEFTVTELDSFLQNVISNRSEQIAKLECNHGMFFYVWFDWMSATCLYITS